MIDQAHIAELTGQEVASLVPLRGGDVAESFRVTLADGTTVFAKTHHNPPPGFFTTEAWGLGWLRDADTIPVPKVLGVSDDPPLLVLEWIDEGSYGRDKVAENGESAFGRALAELHRTGAPCFGREDRRTTGSRGLPNEPKETWVEFYRTQRLEPLTKLATDTKALGPTTLARLEAVAGRLAELGGPPEPPARIHGDLWAGNRLIDRDRRSWLIDPACHGGHREFDLAMMQLFGGFSAACYTSYHETFPLADGWVERVPLHQLAPLVVHAIKFGGGYAGAVDQALHSLGV